MLGNNANVSEFQSTNISEILQETVDEVLYSRLHGKLDIPNSKDRRVHLAPEVVPDALSQCSKNCPGLNSFGGLAEGTIAASVAPP